VAYPPLPTTRPIGRIAARLSLWVLLFGLISCSRIVSLPEVDLEDPQWTIWEGQALWTPRSDLSAVAGDLIVARNADGDVLISFSKSPFPIFTAQTSGRLWRIDFVDKGRSHYGIGRPPKKFIWFHLPKLIEGAPAFKHWEIHDVEDGEWSISNRKTGETIRVVLDR